MDTSSNVEYVAPLEFEVRGINIRLFSPEKLSDFLSPQSYALSRLPKSNGVVDRLGGMGLTVEMDLNGVGRNDTLILPGVEVGSGVTVGAQTQIDEGVVVGINAYIGRRCKVGGRSRIGSDVHLGDDNEIPPYSTVMNRVTIPSGLFRNGLPSILGADSSIEIDQPLVDYFVSRINELVL